MRSPDELTEADLLACCDVPSWAEAIIAGRPYADEDALFATADEAARRFTPDEVERALAAHPRIGERAQGEGTEADWSRQEQSGVAEDAKADLLAANQAYEQRFNRVFLVCATGLSAAEILVSLHSRLDNDDATEAAVVADELRKIALLRLRKVLRRRSQITTHVLDTAAGRPAAGVPVTLRKGLTLVAQGVTNDDGRVTDLGPDALEPGTYQLVFEVGGDFFPEVTITFVVADESHYHVPLLLSPFTYSTYRGS
jgi:hydroxyisourate hydrolase